MHSFNQDKRHKAIEKQTKKKKKKVKGKKKKKVG